MPSWKDLYKASALETNPIEMKKLIYQTEEAMFARFLTLAEEPNGNGNNERQEMADASQGLLGLKTERLNFPSLKSNRRDEIILL